MMNTTLDSEASSVLLVDYSHETTQRSIRTIIITSGPCSPRSDTNSLLLVDFSPIASEQFAAAVDEYTHSTPNDAPRNLGASTCKTVKELSHIRYSPSVM